jgi:DtxR family Mn-dependent transcriptional regulator
MQVGETVENYLETIHILSDRIGNVRSVDIANEMGYSKPSISVMMKRLKKEGFIDIDSDGHITLTEKGILIAEKIYERHLLLTKALIKLGVEEETAKEDACKIEHVLSQETFSKIREHLIQKIQNSQQ